jgi:hypothetical protein
MTVINKGEAITPPYLYIGQEEDEDNKTLSLIPTNMTHVRIDASVTEIPPLTFYFCRDTLQKVDFHPSVMKIGERAFFKCPHIQNINLTKCPEIGDASFFQCAKIKQFVAPALQRIGKGAFFQCIQLNNVTIPASIECIGEYAFYGCHALASPPSPLLQTNLSRKNFEIGQMAFFQCSSLTIVSIPNTVEKLGYGTFQECSSLKMIDFGKSLKEIGNGCFRNCSSLKQIRFSPKLETIGRHSFSGCTLLSSVEVPETLTTLGDYAFSSCESLLNIALSSECQVGRVAFGGCASLFQDSSMSDSLQIHALKTRFEGFPIHKVCYFHAFYGDDKKCMDQLKQAMELTLNCRHLILPGNGMTPFHILALSTEPCPNMWLTLLEEAFPKQNTNSHQMKDLLGNTPLNYLYSSSTSKATEVIKKCVVRNPSVWSRGRSNY